MKTRREKELAQQRKILKEAKTHQWLWSKEIRRRRRRRRKKVKIVAKPIWKKQFECMINQIIIRLVKQEFSKS